MGIFQKNVCFYIGLKKQGTLTKIRFQKVGQNCNKITNVTSVVRLKLLSVKQLK